MSQIRLLLTLAILTYLSSACMGHSSELRIPERQNPEEYSITQQKAIRDTIGNKTNLLQSIVLIQAFKSKSLVTSSTGTIIQGEKGIYILTSYHGIRYHLKIWGMLYDDYQHFPHELELVGFDKSLDIALLKISPLDSTFDHDLVPLPLGDSDSIRYGDPIISIGYPHKILMVDFAEILKPRASSTQLFKQDSLFTPDQSHLIISDTKNNPGSSGGPILNNKGEVIGINIHIIFGGNTLSTSIPVNDIKRRLPLLEEGKEIQRAYLGINFYNTWERPIYYFQVFNLPVPQKPGVFIAKVHENSPAASADLQPGDLIIEYNKQAVTDWLQFDHFIKLDMQPGKPIELKILRGNKYMIKKVTPVLFSELKIKF